MGASWMPTAAPADDTVAHLHAPIWAVWAVGLAAYLVGVMHRTSFGVAGLDAARPLRRRARRCCRASSCCSCWSTPRCRCPPGCCSTGSARATVVAVGGLTMAAGQLLLGTATSLPLAIAARVLVGIGDAFTFVSVFSLVPAWFPPGECR